MTNESSSAGRPPAKLGDSGENDWVRGLPGEKPGKASSHAPDCHDDPSGRAVIEQIFEELSAAQLRAVPPEPVAQDTPQGRASDLQFFQASHAAEGISGAGSFSGQSVSSATKVKRRNGERLRGICGRSAAAFATKAETSIRALRKLSRSMRLRDWQGRYIALLSLVHRHGFDRRMERLLFIKTPVPHSAQAEQGGRTPFLYQGPIPGKALDWALSALPSDLKRYAFVDFLAGNGRTLLLAARRNFEHATGYAFDAGSCEALELNLAQYSRSYMSCRDVRALRGDRDGLAIPMQPAVLFFPDHLPVHHLRAILSLASASQKLNPRPVYLIFESSGRERGLEQMQFFEKVPLSFLNRVKAYLFSPARIAIYKSFNGGSADAQHARPE